ncbi:MAG TPA: hypothetical protein VIL94_05375, partial [Acidothermaceae bacterium]
YRSRTDVIVGAVWVASGGCDEGWSAALGRLPRIGGTCAPQLAERFNIASPHAAMKKAWRKDRYVLILPAYGSTP